MVLPCGSTTSGRGRRATVKSGRTKERHFSPLVLRALSLLSRAPHGMAPITLRFLRKEATLFFTCESSASFGAT
ncbi:hypothetical protein EON67_11960, partial [archaeon]